MYNQFFPIKPRISEKNGGSKVVHLIYKKLIDLNITSSTNCCIEFNDAYKQLLYVNFLRIIDHYQLMFHFLFVLVLFCCQKINFNKIWDQENYNINKEINNLRLTKLHTQKEKN